MEQTPPDLQRELTQVQDAMQRLEARWEQTDHVQPISPEEAQTYDQLASREEALLAQLQTQQPRQGLAAELDRLSARAADMNPYELAHYAELAEEEQRHQEHDRARRRGPGR